ncbi:MAG: hypothetical protein K2P67_06675 [Gallionellaceae bacterium]|nr:hypothetical protein [Gallionellaceae bacterium]
MARLMTGVLRSGGYRPATMDNGVHFRDTKAVAEMAAIFFGWWLWRQY